ncbi:hypothetical protein BDV93DRAFT_581513 [Ceratobasidium sp. AG-I]|nr:hypothetical protein BDV93DRAFT_581513 [Ceratobasidium sp. AG-I]
MRKKIERFPGRLARAKENALPGTEVKPFQLKDHTGAVLPQIRTVVRQLACQGVANERVISIIYAVAHGLGVHVAGSISARTVSRVVGEGLVQARMQLGAELNEVKYLSICGDGTTIKNQQHESKALFLPLHIAKHQQHTPTSEFPKIQPVLRSLGVSKAVNHTAKSQLQGWVDAIELCCETFTRSPLGKGAYLNSYIFASKLRGYLSDHASDQKKLYELLFNWKQQCDRETRGLAVLSSMSTEDQLQALSMHLEQACSQTIGWGDLTLHAQGNLVHEAWCMLALTHGETEFQGLDQEAQDDIDFFGRAGCCMHKELNAVKGGAAAMAVSWQKQGHPGPILLQNKYDAAQSSHINAENAPRGAVKLTSLAGAIFNHKDDKKGYQNCHVLSRIVWNRVECSRTYYIIESLYAQ